MLGILCEEVPQGGNKVVTLLCNSSKQKKNPEDVTQILTNAALHLVWTISEYDVPKSLSVNAAQTGVQYSSGGIATWAPIGSKQVEVVDKDEQWTFTLVVGISMSGEVLLYQAICTGKTAASLPNSNAPNYARATEELKFQFESSGNETYWSTVQTMQSYVTNTLVPYFESHHQHLRLPNQLCIWQIDAWPVHRLLEFWSWMWKNYSWI